MKQIYHLKRIISTGLAVSLVGCSVFLTGCGKNADDGRNEHIELLDPVVVSETCVAAEYRDMYKADTLGALVCPKITEYAMQNSTNFASYVKVCGMDVVAGNELLLGNTEYLDEQIKAKNEYIANMEKEYAKTVEKQQKAVDEKQYAYDSALYTLDSVNSAKPSDKNIVGNGGTDEYADSAAYNAAVSAWEAMVAKYTGPERFAYLDLEAAKQDLKETQELYVVDHNYQLALLSELQSKRDKIILKSGMNGTVVAMNYYNPGDNIKKDAAAVAVGDMSVKEIKCDYVNKSTVKQAEEIYAVLNGKRYEVEYQEMDSDEYERLYSRDGVVYSTFLFKDSATDVKIGDFAVIVIVKETAKNVLSVPTSAIGSDENGKYVYSFDGNSYTTTYIRTGMNDGLYTEVLSGLEDGALVKSEMTISAGNYEAVVEYGDIYGEFSEYGYLFYPSETAVKNPIEYGVTYLDEVCVSRNEQVTKGQVLAKIHVVPDSIEIQKKERELQRANERLQDLINDGEDKNKDLIETQKETIADITKILNKMNSDAACTEIIAPDDGIVTAIIGSEPGDLVQKDQQIASIASNDSCYVVVEDTDSRLTYGNVANVEYNDIEGNARVATGMVVTVSNMALSKDIKTDYALIQLPAEDIAQMAGSRKNSDGMWFASRFKVTVKVRSMEHVLLVPKAAVKENGGVATVTVKEDNGTVRKVDIITGGSDTSNYWIVDGIVEGTTVCWE